MSSLASKVNFNADKIHAKAEKLVERKTTSAVPQNFFDDEKEREAIKDIIPMETDDFGKISKKNLISKKKFKNSISNKF